jgi:RNA polymerase primary sigma factor
MSQILIQSSNPAGKATEIDSMRIAIELEKARRRLSEFLVNNPCAAHFVAGQLPMGPRKNSYGSEDELGGEAPFPQSHSAQAKPSDTQVPDLYSLRLLPLFLIEMADLLDRQPTHKSFNSRYKRRLKAYRCKLHSTRQRMISANTGLVAFAAQKYTTSNLGFDDLIQEGILGLIKAVDRFDPERGICFSTYAMYWIKQAISRLIVKQEKIVRLPLPLAEKAASVFEAMRRCYLQYERWPTGSELKKCCDLPEGDIRIISSYYLATHSLDAAVYNDEDNQQLMEQIAQHQFNLPLDELIDQDLAEFLVKAVASLSEKQGAILTMRFGLQDQGEMTLQAVADRLHVTRERVRQIQNDALKKLKQQFGYDLLPFLDASDSSQ